MAMLDAAALEEMTFWVVFALLSLLIYKLLTKKSVRHLLLVMLPTGVLALALSETLKALIRVPRPCESLAWCPSSFSFPSSHALTAFAVFTVIYLEARTGRRHLALFIVPALIAASRLVLGVHRVEDVVAGSLLGIAVGWGYLKAYYHVEKK